MWENIKTFESYIDGMEDEDFFTQIYNNNPNSKESDFYAFLYKDDFEESPTNSGNYKKSIYIEKMVLIDLSNPKMSINTLHGMELRANFSGDLVLGYIWISKDLSHYFRDKNSDELSFSEKALIREKQLTKNDKNKKNFEKQIDIAKHTILVLNTASEFGF